MYSNILSIQKNIGFKLIHYELFFYTGIQPNTKK